MFEIKYALLALIIVTIIMGTSVYYSNRANNVANSNLRASLPLPTEVSEMESGPLFAGNIEVQGSEIITEETTLAAANDNLETVQPQVDGTITEEAATDSQNLVDTEEDQEETVTVPLTAQTGANSLIFLAAAISLTAGGFGLMILPVAAVRG